MNPKLKELLMEHGAYAVLSETAQWMKDELAPHLAKMGRKDFAERTEKMATEVSRSAHGLLF